MAATKNNAQHQSTSKLKKVKFNLLRREYWAFEETHKEMKEMERRDKIKSGYSKERCD